MSGETQAASFDATVRAAQGHVDARRWGEAIAALERAVALNPDAAGAWRGLGDARHASGDRAGASAAHDRAARLSLLQPPLADAVAAIAGNRLASAEQIVRARLAQTPTDVAAIVLLADLARRGGNSADAVRFLRRALAIAPGHEPAGRTLARLLYDMGELPEALAEFDRLLVGNPKHPGYRTLRAAILDLLGDHDAAADAYRAMLSDDPAQPLVWMTLGNVRKTVGDIPGAIAAFRQSLALAPGTGESWWGLANLKSYRFEAAEITTMQQALSGPDLSQRDRICANFALGKAFEDAASYAESFAYYSAGNRLQLALQPHDAEELGVLVERCRALFTPAFFAQRAGFGDPATDPIFIVGLPRSGSTLVEQILASHLAIEATMELPELPRIVRILGGGGNVVANRTYPASLAHLSSAQASDLGTDYLRRAARWRRSDRPYFIDKLPMNFVSIGLIRLILPNARIIDVRRHPLGCGFAIFKQYFPQGLSFATGLEHIGRFSADYLRMMEVWDSGLPGRIHHLGYEDLVADPEAEIRRMLDFLGLPFDSACLAFHTRAGIVRTPSAEQVRRPIYADAVEHWRHYEPWLGPMKAALGDIPENDCRR